MTAGDRPVEIVIHRLALPLLAPIRSGHGVETSRDVIVVEALGADGVSGWGECSALALPTYSAEFAAAALIVLRDVLAPAALRGGDVGAVEHPMARAGMGGAILDLQLRRRGTRLVDRVANRLGAPRAAVERCVVIGRGGPQAVIPAVDLAVERGAAAVKLKVTPAPDDLAAVEAVRRAHPDLPLAVDANGTLDPRSVGILDELGLLYMEQPAPADDLVVSATYARHRGTPIVLDESIRSVGSVESVAALGAAAAINVKPARLGGVDAAIEVIQRARDLGLGAFVGGMFEGGIGRAAALALAASSALDLPTDLGPTDAYLAADVVGPIGVDALGRVEIPTGPGIGVEPDPGLLAGATVSRETVT